MKLKTLLVLGGVMLAALGFVAAQPGAALAAKDVKLVLYSPVTTTDPWDANDTISLIPENNERIQRRNGNE